MKHPELGIFTNKIPCNKEYYPYEPPEAEKAIIFKKSSQQAENIYRFRKAGYRDEVHFRMLRGMDVKIPAWSTTGFIKKLPECGTGRLHHFCFCRECRDTLLSHMRGYSYSLQFMDIDAQRIALFRMRFASVQLTAEQVVEKKRETNSEIHKKNRAAREKKQKKLADSNQITEENQPLEKKEKIKRKSKGTTKMRKQKGAA